MPYVVATTPLSRLHPLSLLSAAISVLESVSSYALVCVGITGEAFWPSARRARDLTGRVKNSGKGGRRKGTAVRSKDYSRVSSLLVLSSLSLSIFCAVAGYIFTAHTLASPASAVLSALIAGGLAFLTSRFGLGLSEDAADAMYICYRIDMDQGTQHRGEVFNAFEGPVRTTTA